MKLSEICIRRPVFAWVITLILMLLGLVGWYRLSIQQYPKSATEQASITIETQYQGAGADVIENAITAIIEEACAGLEGVIAMTSNSTTGESKVTLEFSPERNINDAANDIRDRLSRYKSRLPQDGLLTEPTLTRQKADDQPIIHLALTSKTIPIGELHDFAKREIDKTFEALPGVSRVEVIGAGEYKMNIYLDPTRLMAHHLTVPEVMDAIKRQNLESPAGTLTGKDREYQITMIATLEKPEEFENLVLTSKNGRPIRIKDIGRAELSSDDKKTITHINGQKGITIAIYKQSDANPITISEAVAAEIEKTKRILSDDMKLEVAYDTTTFIKKSINHVYRTILEATGLVILVVFLFLRSIRASIIPLITIPVSLISTLFLMYILGFSINVFTLMALVLAIGLVVDDAIVVLENIFKYMERGDKAYVAAFKGIREISFAVVAMTLTLAAVYTPVALAKGMTGKLLTEFSITLAGSVCISGLVALTLSPMMSSRLLVHYAEGEEPNTLWNKFKRTFLRTDKWIHSIEERYQDRLTSLLNRRRLLLVIIAAAFSAIGAIVFLYLPSEMVPREDKGLIYINGSGPQTATREFTDRYIRLLDKSLSSIPEIEQRLINIQNPTYTAWMQLKSDRKRTTQQIADELDAVLKKVAIGIEVTSISTGNDALGGTPIVNLVVRANKSHREMKGLASQLIQELYKTGIVKGITSETLNDIQEYIINIHRDKAGEMNIDISSIAKTVEALRGKNTNKFKRESRLYDVHAVIDPELRKAPDDITNLYIKSELKRKDQEEPYLVPLSELIDVYVRSGAKNIHRHDRMRAVSINVLLKPSVSLDDAIKQIGAVANDVVPKEARFNFVGETKRYLDETNIMVLIFGLALCFIYFVMAAQFESWRDPLIIMLSVPLSLSGALVTLALLPEGTRNLYSNVGMITLIGLITKHGILMVDFANTLRDEGIDKFNAIIKSCRARLRPILMTTFAMVLGAVPLALAVGEGSERLRQIGWTIVGGMSIGTLFTLFVIPAFYMYITPRHRKGIMKLPV